MIRLQCACGRKIAAPEQWLGKRVKCPQCGQPVLVLQSTVAPPAERAVASLVAPPSTSSRLRASQAAVVESAMPRSSDPSPAQNPREAPTHAEPGAAAAAEEPAVKMDEPPDPEIEFSPPPSSPFGADAFAEDPPESAPRLRSQPLDEEPAFISDSAQGERTFAKTGDRQGSIFADDASADQPGADEPFADDTSADDAGADGAFAEDGFTHEASTDGAFAEEAFAVGTDSSGIDESGACESQSAPQAEETLGAGERPEAEQEPEPARTSFPNAAFEGASAPTTEPLPTGVGDSKSTPAATAPAPPPGPAPYSRRRNRPIPVDPQKLGGDEDDFESRRARIPFLLGVLGILAGLAGAAALWFPQYALYGIPVCGLGVALGAIGAAVSMSRYRIGLAAPLIAMIISGAAIALPFAFPKLSTTATVAGRVSVLQKQADEQRAAQEAGRRGVLEVKSLELVSPDADTQTPELKYALVNKSGKTIAAFDGSVQLYDQDHNPLGGLQLGKRGPFAPGAEIDGKNIWTLDPQVRTMIADHKTTAEYRADWVRFDDGKTETFNP